MKRIFYPFILLLLAMGACTNKNVNLVFVNNTGTERNNEVVSLPGEITRKIVENAPTGKKPVLFLNNQALVSQCIDIDLDGRTDSILVEISILPQDSIVTKVLYMDDSNYPIFKRKTDIRFAYHTDYSFEPDTATRIQTIESPVTSAILQMEGPAWENDKVGFRNYFDLRNGMDIFGKLTEDPVLEMVGRNEKTVNSNGIVIEESYHSLQTWGMDILKVGNSLGAGGIALWKEDSLYRIGDNGTGNYTMLYEGPLRSSFRFDFVNWKAKNDSYHISQIITITAGEYCYHSRLKFETPPGNARFVTGIVNKHNAELLSEQAEDGSSIMLTHTTQAYDSSFLGLALVIPAGMLDVTGSTANTGSGITETWYAKMNLLGNESSEYYFYALWSRSDPAFLEKDFCMSGIKAEVFKRDHPVQVHLKP